MSVSLFLSPFVGVLVVLVFVGLVFLLVRMNRLRKKGIAKTDAMFVVNGRGSPVKKNKSGFRGETVKSNQTYGDPTKGVADYFTPNLTANALSCGAASRSNAD